MDKSNLIESIDYKSYKINVYQDLDSNYLEDDLKDDPDLFLTAYHRDFSVDSKLISKDECIALANGNEDEEIDKYRFKELGKTYHWFGLEAYIHSGVVLALRHEGNFPDRQWDVSQLGMCFASKKEYKTRGKAKKAVLSLIKEWNMLLNGDMAGYMVENKDGAEFGGCWGFVGYSEAKEQMIEEAKGEIEEDITKVKAEEKAKIDNYNNLLTLFAGSKKELSAYLDKYFTDPKFKADINRNFNSIKAIITKKI